MDVRLQAIHELSTTADPKAPDHLLEVLTDESNEVRLAAYDALVAMEARAEPALLAGIDHPNEVIRCASISALGQRKVAAATLLTLGHCRDSSHMVRLAAYEALGEIGDRRAVKPCVSALADGDVEIRRIALRTLAKLGDNRVVPQILPLLEDPDLALQRDAALTLDPLRWTGLGTSMTVTVTLAVEAWLLSGRVTVDDNDPELQALAQNVWELMQEVTPHCAHEADRLAHLLGRDEHLIRAWAAEALGHVQQPRVPVLLLSAAAVDEEEIVRHAAFEALVRQGPAAMATLLSALSGHDLCMLLSACEALAKLGDPRARAPLMRLLGDDRRPAEVHRAALEALQALDRHQHQRRLEEAQADPSGHLRRIAVSAFSEQEAWAPRDVPAPPPPRTPQTGSSSAALPLSGPPRGTAHDIGGSRPRNRP